ncbi:MAG: 4'-phosphopantetheinyl transferase family protein [Rhodoglobus sp.]
MTLELRFLRLPLSAQQRAEALAVLSPAEVERYTVTPRDDFIAGRLLLRTVLAELTGAAPDEVVLDATCPDCGKQHGRVTAPGTDLYVSISHSAEVAVVAVADVPIGIDVESEPSPEALAAIGAVAGEASITRWTRVEAVLKADGRGLRVDPRHVVFDGDLAWIDGAPERYRLSEVELEANDAPGIQVTIASLFRRI